MNGSDYTSLGLIKLCPQPEIHPRLRAARSESRKISRITTPDCRDDRIARSSVPEKKNENDDWKRNAKHPQKKSSTHVCSPFHIPGPRNVSPGHLFLGCRRNAGGAGRCSEDADTGTVQAAIASSYCDESASHRSSCA